MELAQHLGRTVCVDDHSITYATAGGVTIATRRTEATVKWLRGGWAMGNRFDLHTRDGTYRCYLTRPSNTAPRLRKSLVREAAEHLATGGNLVSVGQAWES